MKREAMIRELMAAADGMLGWTDADAAISEAASASKVYARTGEWPKLVSSRAWAAIGAFKLTDLAEVRR